MQTTFKLAGKTLAGKPSGRRRGMACGIATLKTQIRSVARSPAPA
jgi:hypothetical protein